MQNPYQTPGLHMPTSADVDGGLRVPRLRLWHACLWLTMICLFSYLAVKWMINWETTRGRVAPINRLVWNAFSIHTGPFAGVYYWDYGHHRPMIYQRSGDLVTSKHRGPHRAIVTIVLPLFLLLVLPSTGFLMRPMRKRWRVLIGIAFVVGTGLWYFSAMVSVAMLS